MIYALRLLKFIFCISFFACLVNNSYAQGIISTIAGNGKPGFRGDNGTPDTCELFNPFDISLDTAGDIYISDGNNLRVRKIKKATGIITTIAGNGSATYSGDSVLGSTAGLNPYGIFADAVGNVYIADVGNNRVRKIDAVTGIITTIAGTGTQGYSGDTGLAINEQLYWPSDVCIDTAGNIYIADQGNNRVRKITLATGKISTIAGNGTPGYSGDGGAATSATLNAPTYLCTDKQGNVYISDVNNNVIRKVDAASGKISTVAGNDTAGFSGDGGLAINAELLSPAGIYVNAQGNLYIADENNDRIRMVSSGYINTVAGGGTSLGDGHISTNAQLSGPTGIYADSAGAFYIADMHHQRIRYVAKPNAVINVATPVQFSIYPNPSTGIFNVNCETLQKPLNIEIYNIVGTRVYSAAIKNNISEIDLGRQPSGIYFVIINYDGMKATQKLVLQN